MKLDILVLAAHPDDAELSCSGTIAKHVAMGHKVGIVDFTQGELGTRGTEESRKKEAEASSRVLGLSVRNNLKLADGFFTNNKEAQISVIKAIRKYQPEVLISNAISDRHPDHQKGSRLAVDAAFLSGLIKIETSDGGYAQKVWRPKFHYHYIQDRYIKPDFIVDISEHWETKVEAIRAFKTQFFNPSDESSSKGPQTHISTPEFMKFLEARSREYGHYIGAEYGEGFTVERTIGVDSLLDLR